MMVDLTAVDWYRKKEPRFELVVQFLSISKNSRKTVKVKINDENLKIQTITDLYPSFLIFVITSLYSSAFTFNTSDFIC